MKTYHLSSKADKRIESKQFKDDDAASEAAKKGGFDCVEDIQGGRLVWQADKEKKAKE